jgi:PBP1b-binding outer membrane lipoprotein LpoB
MKKLFLALCLCVSAVIFSGCITPAPIAANADPVVVMAERVQQTSLSAYQALIEWELANRAALPAEISRAVDDAREEFPVLWKASRSALKDYQAKAGPNADTMNRITAGLSAAQNAFLSLHAQDATQINSLTAALLQLLDATNRLTAH